MPRFSQEKAGLIEGIIEGLWWWMKSMWESQSDAFFLGGHLALGGMVLDGSWMGAWWLDLTTPYDKIPGVFRTQYIPLALYRLINSWSFHSTRSNEKSPPQKTPPKHRFHRFCPQLIFPLPGASHQGRREKNSNTQCVPKCPMFSGANLQFFRWWYTWVIGDTVGYIHLEDHPSSYLVRITPIYKAWSSASWKGSATTPSLGDFNKKPWLFTTDPSPGMMLSAWPQVLLVSMAPSDPWPLGVGKGAGKGILRSGSTTVTTVTWAGVRNARFLYMC